MLVAIIKEYNVAIRCTNIAKGMHEDHSIELDVPVGIYMYDSLVYLLVLR